MCDTSGKTIKIPSHMQDWKAWEENDGEKNHSQRQRRNILCWANCANEAYKTTLSLQEQVVNNVDGSVLPMSWQS